MLKKIFFIFQKIKKFKNAFDVQLIIGFTLIASFLEIFGLTAIGTFISGLSAEFSNENVIIQFLKDFFEINDKQELFKYSGYLIIFLFTIISFINAYIFSFITQKSNNYVSYLSTALFKKYLDKNYFFFTKESLPTLTKNIINETHTVVNQIIFPIFILISKVLTTLVIIVFLFFYNVKVTSILSAILLVSYLLIYLLFKSKLFYLGKKIIFENARKYKIVQETLFGIKEIKLFNLKEKTLKNLKYSLDKFYKYRSLSSLITLLPKFLIEVVIVTIFIFFILFTFDFENKNNSTIPTLAVFVVASSRLFPSFQNIYSSIGKIKNSGPSFELVLNELKSNKFKDFNISKKKREIIFKNHIILKNIYFRYNNDENYIFKNLSLKIKKNSIFGIKGKSGIGKSTLADIISGLVLPQKGKIKLDNISLGKKNINSWRSRFSYVPQKVFLFDDSIKNNILLKNDGEKQFNKSKFDNSTKTSRLDKFIKTKSLKENYMITGNGMNISGGQRQRIGIARCLYYNKDIIIFDEATAGLDKLSEKNILKTIKNLSKNTTIIIISHSKNVINICDNYIDLDNFYNKKNKSI